MSVQWDGFWWLWLVLLFYAVLLAVILMCVCVPN